MADRFLPAILGCYSIFLVMIPAFAADSTNNPPLPNVTAPECAVQPESFLSGRLSFWQQRLKLGDWKISIVMSAASDLKPKTMGNVHWDTDKKTAVIRVLSAADYQLACHDMLNDMELTVVHELVHLELSSLPRSPASRREEEHAVNRITDALLAFDRQSDSQIQGSR
jgi:hypothetical protein